MKTLALTPALSPRRGGIVRQFLEGEHLQNLDVGLELPVGRDSVEPIFERSEANAVSILLGLGREDARCARTVCDVRVDSDWSLAPSFGSWVRKHEGGLIPRRQ
jgi:hypothetical protein